MSGQYVLTPGLYGAAASTKLMRSVSFGGSLTGAVTLSFQGAVASGTRDMWFYVFYDQDPAARAGYCTATLTTQLTTFSCVQDLIPGRSDYRIAFDLGAATNLAAVTLDNVALSAP